MRSNARGVAILFKRGVAFKIQEEIIDPEGRFLLLQVKFNEDLITFLNLYAPTQSEGREQEEFIRKVGNSLDKLEVSDLYVGGDFNVQLDRPSSLRTNSNLYISGILSLMEEYSLSDLWREKFPNNHRGTFHRGTYSAR